MNPFQGHNMIDVNITNSDSRGSSIVISSMSSYDNSIDKSGISSDVDSEASVAIANLRELLRQQQARSKTFKQQIVILQKHILMEMNTINQYQAQVQELAESFGIGRKISQIEGFKHNNTQIKENEIAKYQVNSKNINLQQNIDNLERQVTQLRQQLHAERSNTNKLQHQIALLNQSNRKLLQLNAKHTAQQQILKQNIQSWKQSKFNQYQHQKHINQSRLINYCRQNQNLIIQLQKAQKQLNLQRNKVKDLETRLNEVNYIKLSESVLYLEQFKDKDEIQSPLHRSNVLNGMGYSIYQVSFEVRKDPETSMSEFGGNNISSKTRGGHLRKSTCSSQRTSKQNLTIDCSQTGIPSPTLIQLDNTLDYQHIHNENESLELVKEQSGEHSLDNTSNNIA